MLTASILEEFSTTRRQVSCAGACDRGGRSAGVMSDPAQLRRDYRREALRRADLAADPVDTVPPLVRSGSGRRAGRAQRHGAGHQRWPPPQQRQTGVVAQHRQHHQDDQGHLVGDAGRRRSAAGPAVDHRWAAAGSGHGAGAVLAEAAGGEAHGERLGSGRSIVRAKLSQPRSISVGLVDRAVLGLEGCTRQRPHVLRTPAAGQGCR